MEDIINFVMPQNLFNLIEMHTLMILLMNGLILQKDGF